MAEDDDDASKTEDPTGKKLSDAREKGNVPMSQEAKNWLMLLGGLVVVSLVAPASIRRLSDALVGFFERAGTERLDQGMIGLILADTVLTALLAILLPVIIMAAAGVLGTILQIGWLVTAEKMKPDLTKLNPLPAFMRLFSMQNSLEMVKGFVKMAVVGVVCAIVLRPVIASVEHYVGMPMDLLLAETQYLVVKLFLWVTIIMLFVAMADFFYQRFEYTKKMRMTKQDVKEEFKQQEGDPIVKARLRQMRFDKARRRMMQAVPRADVVVTNPTHFAVALKYDQSAMAAPVVLAKGADAVAAKIREIAREHDIPLVENPPLARALYAAVEIDQEIPPEHYKAMAEVISYVFKLKNRFSGR
ncbi:flagellar biosynthesis protein FlhB [Skermanella pratensis]|uniref:flagellar biosynthesis protein FlhB n=1 Tax=Skermanella pratensis TaxID=2233999 RepID=UPI001300CAFA|nr:flagellar biosynthesis protein FlhB [Skermanella pratensis]